MMLSKNEISNDILELVKKAGATRVFLKKKVEPKAINKIIEAGRWSSSILGIQPWVLIYIKNDDIKSKISKMVYEKSTEIDKPFSAVLKITSDTVMSSGALIAVYNNGQVATRAEKYGDVFKKKAYIAEIQCIGGMIQSMILEANSLGLGSVWLDSPTFFNEAQINKLLEQEGELIAFLAIGYPVKASNRSKRVDFDSMVKTID